MAALASPPWWRVGLVALAGIGCGWAFAFMLYAGLAFPYPDAIITLPVAVVFGVPFVAVFFREWPWLSAISYPLLSLEFLREVWITLGSDSFGVFLAVSWMWIWGPYLLGLPLWAVSLDEWIKAARQRVQAYPKSHGG